MPTARMTDLALLVLRLGAAGLMVVFHGQGKLFRAVDYVVRGDAWPFVNVVDGLGFPAPPVFAVLSAVAESVCAMLVAVGLWTRLAGSALAVNMLVATLSERLGGDPIELPAIYVVVAVTVVLAGAGRYSVDAALMRRRAARDRPAAIPLAASVSMPRGNVR